ncbi:MAG: hypothetical protein MJZ75_06500 [Paludibacteraceae bacterium]|nr:hypothetical protein [Paludibacteraceae bacterium]
MPYKDSYQLQLRNNAIRDAFAHYIQTGLPFMDAYAKVASEFYLSEESVRKIVAKRN